MKYNSLNIKNIIYRLLLSTAISCAMLAFLFYVISSAGEDINLSKLIDIIRNITPQALVWYLITQLIGVGLRSLRYRSLLYASGDHTHPGFKELFPVTLVRNMTVDLLPARIGELVFVGLLKRIKNTHVSHSLSSLVFATLFDIAVILPIVFILALFILTERQTQLTLFSGVVIILSCLILVYFAMKKIAPWFNEEISAFSEKHDNKIIQKFANFSSELTEAIQSTIERKQLNNVIWLTIGLRITKYLGLCLLFLGVVHSNFPQLINIPTSQLISILIAGETAASLPVPTFLSLGSYEAGSAGMLTLFGVGMGTAVLIMLALHISSQIVDYSLGLVGVGWLLFRPESFKQINQENSPSGLGITITSLIAILGLTVLFLGFQATRNAWSLNAPAAGKEVAMPDDNQTINGWDSSSAFIVWSSNRGGNHDIYHMTLPDREVTQLTNHPHTENLPKISPDGKKIIFQRGRKPWHSFRDSTPWDVIIKDIQSGLEKILVKNAHDASWMRDGRNVSFRRNNSHVYTVDINTGEETKVYESSMLNLPAEAGLQTPVLNSKGELAVTVRGPLRMTAVYKINNSIHIGQGCQIMWSPDESFVYYIDHDGKGQNLFKRYDFDEGKSKVWMDMPGEYSHEYFPKLTKDGKWLVFGASTGGHEHDTADYELFLWKVNTDPKNVIRLTHHSGNDSWPDIFVYQ